MISLRNTEADAPPAPRPRKIVDGGFLVLAALTTLAAIAVAVTRGPGRVFEIIGETAGFIAALAPKIAAGAFIAATVPLLLPRDRVAASIGRESGLRGLVLAGIAGAAVPGGPMMIFLLASGFATAGADLGATVAFISGWALLGLNRTLIWEFSFLPTEIVWVRYLISLPFPILIGVLARLVLRPHR